MKAGQYYFILVVFAGILCVSSLCDAELLQSDQSGVIAQPNPALTGINAIFVAIDAQGIDPNNSAWIHKDLDWKLIDSLQKSDITVNPSMGGNFRDSATLRVTLNWLNLQSSQRRVFHSQISLERMVILPRQPDLYFGADVWKSKPVMQAVLVEEMPAKVTDVVLEQVEAFIHTYLASNPPNKQPADANDISIVLKEQAKPVAKSKPAKYEYVASKNSQVFHKPGCRWAENISENNLVRYDSREEAIKAGKRPCKSCKP